MDGLQELKNRIRQDIKKRITELERYKQEVNEIYSGKVMPDDAQKVLEGLSREIDSLKERLETFQR
jgi:hypothetical protein